MDEIGFENTKKIKTIDSETDRWRFIYEVAKTYGFEGVHFTPSLYRNFDLDLKNIPDYFQEFRLSLHFGGGGGIQGIASENEYEAFDRGLEYIYEIAVKHNMHDISIHPYGSKLTEYEKGLSLENLNKIVEKWLKKLNTNGISLSLETHVAGDYFLLNGLHEYVKFVDNHPELGVLIDISHNYYNPQYSEHDIVSILGNKNVKGLHISDALRGAGFEEGTHLAIGNGTIDFPKLLRGFEKFSDLYCVLEIKSENDGIKRSLTALNDIVK